MKKLFMAIEGMLPIIGIILGLTALLLTIVSSHYAQAEMAPLPPSSTGPMLQRECADAAMITTRIELMRVRGCSQAR